MENCTLDAWWWGGGHWKQKRAGQCAAALKAAWPLPGAGAGWKSREAWNMFPAFWLFRGFSWGTGFYFAWFGVLTQLAYSIETLGLLRMKENWVACSNSREPVVLQTDTRGSKDYKQLKRNWQIPIIENLKDRPGEDTSTEKVWKVPRISHWAD